MNKPKPNLTGPELESKLLRLDKLLASSTAALSNPNLNEKDRMIPDIRSEYRKLLQIKEDLNNIIPENKTNKSIVEFRKKIENNIEKCKLLALDRLHKLQISQEERYKFRDAAIKILQNFLIKINEKRIKQKLDRPSILMSMERCEILKRKFEADYYIIFFPEHFKELRLLTDKILGDQDMLQDLDRLIESLEEINSFIPEQNRRADPIIIDDVNDFQGPDVFDNSRKTEKMQTVNKNPFSDLSNSEFPKREDNGINYLLKMMETSFLNMPEYSDYYPTEQGKETNYPKSLFPKRRLMNEQVFEKMDIDTLFFIFYSQKGTYEQLLAARALKNNYWRFHKKHLTWFKRMEEPRESTEEYEKGTYAAFDHEKGWCQKKKVDFTFKYHYLEDEI